MATYTHDWLCREIVRETRDAIILADREGIIRLWNPGAEAVFGYRADEALGRTLDLIIPERLRDRWAGHRRSMATGTTHYARRVLAVPAVRKDGTSISVEFTIALLHDPDGALLGPAAVIRDVTARWQEERAEEAPRRESALTREVTSASAWGAVSRSSWASSSSSVRAISPTSRRPSSPTRSPSSSPRSG